MLPKSVTPFVVPLLVAVYIGAFWHNIAGQSLQAVGFPELLILCIAVLLVADVVRSARQLRRGDGASPSDATTDTAAADAALTGESPVPAAQAETGPLTIDEEGPLDIGRPPAVPSAGLRGWLSSAEGQRTMPMIAIIVALVAYYLLMTRIGAYPSTALFVVGLSLALGYRRYWLILISAVVCVAVVGLFIQIFTLPLPTFGSSLG